VGDGKVGTVPSRSRHLGIGERNKRKGSDEEMLRPGQRAGRRAFHQCAKRRPTADEATVRKEQVTADLPRRARRKGFISFALLFHLNKNTGMLRRRGFGVGAYECFIGPKITRQEAALRLRS
jgi:hypothetical protein